uniref:Putative secreted protein n=1 Tax=Anopheles darlingi TaxID=43151 RepID=A0A2M4DEA8_ANODA
MSGRKQLRATLCFSTATSLSAMGMVLRTTMVTPSVSCWTASSTQGTPNTDRGSSVPYRHRHVPNKNSGPFRTPTGKGYADESCASSRVLDGMQPLIPAHCNSNNSPPTAKPMRLN